MSRDRLEIRHAIRRSPITKEKLKVIKGVTGITRTAIIENAISCMANSSMLLLIFRNLSGNELQLLYRDIELLTDDECCKSPRFPKDKPDLDDVDLLPEQDLQNTSIMNKEIKVSKTTVETVHKVNGMDVKVLSKSQLVDAVKAVELEIKELEAVESESTAITEMIKETKETLSFIVKHLDSKE